MNEEAGFLSELLENPADDTTRLVYADWLDERGDELNQRKSQFLRITVRLLEPKRSTPWRKARRKELQPLAANLPPDWLAIVSRLQIDSCGARRARNSLWEVYRRQFEFVCQKRWDEMTVTGDNAVRFCEDCQENVHYCDTIVVAREHAQQGHCVAVDLGIIRRDKDLGPQGRPLLGIMLPNAVRRIRMESNLDEVSRAREKAKREAQKAAEQADPRTSSE